ncbi:MAG TPA: SpoIIE family protein phosphatase [Solirubrobacteraceae bacterium]|jgi:PAS domain S-box-containing protein|nr:SpoIIE family protein phosphatase [Solirubrobacteraceae bacterium]
MAATLTELLLDRAHSAVVSMNEQGVVTYWNPSAERIFGRARDEMVGQPMVGLIVPERFREAHLKAVSHFLATGEGPALDRRIEMAALRRDGSEFPAEITLSALHEGPTWTFHAFIRDISDRRDAEQENERLVRELRRALHWSERRFDAIVGSLSDPVTIRDRDHRFVYANRAAVAQLGFDSWEALRDTSPDAVMADYLVYGEDGRPLSMEDIPSVRILRGEPAEPLMIHTVHRRTGARRWQLLKSAPLLDPSGAVEATIMIIEDVTERKRAELQAEFLARASEVLASSLGYEQTLRNVAELAVPEIADWCAVDLVDEQGERRSVAVAHGDPARVALVERLRATRGERPDPTRGMDQVLATGEPVLYRQVTDDMLRAAATDEDELALLQELGFRSGMIVPVRLGDRTLGAMTLVSAESGRVLDEFDLRLAEQVAARAAVAIENSRLYSERSAVAHTLQQSLLPERLPQIPGYELATIYAPAVQSTEVGGDFYDAWAIDGAWMIVIGDVTGKGVQAAALTSLVRHSLRAASEFESRPARLLAHVDRALKKQHTLSICTALCLRLQADRVTMAVGGHPLPLALTAQGVRQIGASGPLLGGFPEVEWEDLVFEIEPGTTLVTYTDGITDAVGEDGSRYGLPRLGRTLAQCTERDADQVVGRLSHALDEFQAGGGHADDIALLALHRRPDGGA